ncbi:phosphoglucosamine mutase [Mucisphaera sp.]|uniref:phosphoglucosamine mutase n=1 Tax=Mucisphaera sp. TaxID=2913024 RepID=UPI003D0D4BF0
MSKAPLMLGVSGLRGIVGESLTPAVAYRYGLAVGQIIRETGKIDQLLIGRDSRPSGPELAASVAAGLAEAGVRAVDLGICSTPAVGIAAKKLNSFGIVLTASHNPTPWNGIKLIKPDGSAPRADEAQKVVDRFKQLADIAPPSSPERTQIDPSDFDASAEHAQAAALLIDVQAVQARPFKVVVDSVCGAGGAEARALLEALGVQLIHLHDEPTGAFPHEPEPLEQNLTELAEAVRKHGADAGFAQDPDADRLAIIDNTGRYIGEECTLALAARHRLQKGDVAVANLSTSRMIDDLAANVGADVVRSAVGEANVAAVMQQKHAVLGGEGNGGVIDPRLSHIRDSLVAMVLVLEHMAETDQTLAELRDSLPVYVMSKNKVPRPDRPFEQITEALMQKLSDARVDQTDGVRFDYANKWLHVRTSNTEPILRFIAEAPTLNEAEALASEAAEALEA